MKREIYNFIVKQGLKVLSILFPNIHMSVPLKPSDRFLEYPFVFSHLPSNKNAKILDIGCAGSFFPLIIAALGYDVTACDIRPYEILTNLKFGNFKFVQQDILKNRLAKESFNMVTCISVLEHIGLEGRYGSVELLNGDLSMVREIYRILKTNGSTIITLPYGISKVVKPYHRVYDYNRIKEIESSFKVIEEKFYKTDPNGNWLECDAEEGEKSTGGKDKYNLSLLYLQKP